MAEETIHGLQAAVDPDAFEQFAVRAGACRLRVDVHQKPDGSSEQRGMIPEPMRLRGKLWIAAARGQKIFTRQEGENISLEWEHLILREVVPVEAWKEAVERDPVHRMDTEDYRGYAVLDHKTRAEFVLTGKRIYLFADKDPVSREVVNPAVDHKRRRKGPPPVSGETARQMALL